MTLVVKCINRNILECKDGLRSVNQSSYPGINRNILECKETYKRL